MRYYLISIVRAMTISTLVVFYWSPAVAANTVDSLRIVSESQNNLTLDVVYNYSGDHGDNVFAQVLMADSGTVSKFYAARPGKVRRGRHRVRVTLGTSQRAPEIFSTNELQVDLYVGGRKPFLRQSFIFSKTWSQPNAVLQPSVRLAIGRAFVVPSGGSAKPVERRILPNGHVQIRYPDGRIVELFAGGQIVTTPDGQRQQFLYSSAQPPTPPSHPPDSTHQAWVQSENELLLSAIRNLVGQDEPSIQNYLAQEDPNLSPYARIDLRTRVIDRLVRP